MTRMMSSSGNPMRPIRSSLSSRWPADTANSITSKGVVLLALSLLAPAGGPAPAQFASGVNLVEVYVTVTDSRGEPVTTLTKSDFEVREDGEVQTITAFASGEVPLAVALAVDRSFSMAGERLALARRAGREFLRSLRPSDRSMLLAIGSDTEVVAPLSSDRLAQISGLEALTPWSTTGLHDAIIAAINLIQPNPGRRALVLISDGQDRYSDATAAQALEAARRSDVLVYPLAVGKNRPALFAELAALTGGRSFFVTDPRQLESTLSTIVRELHHQYLLGYTPSRPMNPAQAEFRSIRVEVRQPGLQVRARDGYLAK